MQRAAINPDRLTAVIQHTAAMAVHKADRGRQNHESRYSPFPNRRIYHTDRAKIPHMRKVMPRQKAASRFRPRHGSHASPAAAPAAK